MFGIENYPAKIEKIGRLQRKELQFLEFLELDNVACGGGRKGGTNTAIPHMHMVAREYRNTA